MEVSQNSQKFRVRYRKVVSVPRVLWQRRTELKINPGTGMNVIENLQKIRVWVRKRYRTRRNSGYCGKGAHNPHKFHLGMKMMYLYPGYCDTGVQKLQKFRVRV